MFDWNEEYIRNAKRVLECLYFQLDWGFVYREIPKAQALRRLCYADMAVTAPDDGVVILDRVEYILEHPKPSVVAAIHDAR